MRVSVLVLAALTATACGGSGAVSADSLRTCVAKHVPVFASGSDAEDAEKAEARLGDAHDRRAKNVLYSGGGAVEDAIVECVS